MRVHCLRLVFLLVAMSAAPPCAAQSYFRRGDANQDGVVDISDPAKVLNILFRGDPSLGCDDAMDFNDDGELDISDGAYGLGFLFQGGPRPAMPFPDCGADDTGDALACASYPLCCLVDAVSVVSFRAESPAGGSLRKGDTLRLTMTLRNEAGHAGSVTITPRLVSLRFTDFAAVPLGSVEVSLDAGEVKEVYVEAGPFLDDEARGKHYALGRGGYSVSSVRLECASGESRTLASALTSVPGRSFTVAPSDAVFTAVVYDAGYLQRIRYTQGIERYVSTAFTRRCEVFVPSSPGSSSGTYQTFQGGFDQMLGITQHFRYFPGFTASNAAGGFCEQADAYARQALGLTRDWDVAGNSPTTDPDHHGFDVLVGLTPDFGGGATCGWLGTQVSGLFDFDLSLNRSQIILVHEMGHIFGSPHCDPLQGFVMCAGELHPHYVQGSIFVWHKTSRDAMRSPFN